MRGTAVHSSTVIRLSDGNCPPVRRQGLGAASREVQYISKKQAVVVFDCSQVWVVKWPHCAIFSVQWLPAKATEQKKIQLLEQETVRCSC